MLLRIADPGSVLVLRDSTHLVGHGGGSTGGSGPHGLSGWRDKTTEGCTDEHQ